MTDDDSRDSRAEPDALVGLIPVDWPRDQLEALTDVHADLWGESLAIHRQPEADVAACTVGDARPVIRVDFDEPLPDLAELVETAKRPFEDDEAARLEEHTSVWRLTMDDVSEAPVERARRFARLVTTAIEAGAPGVFFPFCLQLHSPSLVKQLAADFDQPPALVNLYVNAWNDDDWMITRGMTVFGFPEIETRIDTGLNDAYFRLMDVAAGMLFQGNAYPDGARIELGPRTFDLEKGPAGPDDTMVPICGAFGRLTLQPQA